jgi:hypothetical protein
MFNIDILGNEKQHKVEGTTDVTAALMDVSVAEEGLLVSSMELALATTALENIEDGVALADAIAAKGDETSAVVVANEVLRQNLKVLGQEAVASQVTAGTESIVAANESITDMLKKAWEKTKEMALKVWKWIVDMVSKAGHFLMGLIGKGDSTYERIKKLVKKHKDAKTTNLDGQEFSESVQKAINAKFKLLAVDKNIDASNIVKVLEANQESLKEANEGRTEILGSTISNTDAVSTIVDFYKNIVDTNFYDKDGKFDKTKKTNFIGALEKITGQLPLSGGSIPKSWTFGTKSAPSTKELEKMVQEGVEDAISDASGGLILTLSEGVASVRCLAVYVSEDHEETLEDFKSSKAKDEFDPAKCVNAALKVVKSIKVKEVNVSPEESDYEDNFKDVAPLEFSEIENIQDALKDADKQAGKIIKSYGDKITKEKKDLEKAVKTEFITNKDAKEDLAKVAPKARTIVNALISIKTTVAKALATGAINAAKEVISANEVYDYCSKSAALYKKD